MGQFLQQIIKESKNVHGRDINLGVMPDYLKDDVITSMKNQGMSEKDIDLTVNSTDEDEKYSLQSKGVLSANDNVFPERFEKEKIELIKKSENIVEEYKNYINFEFDKIIKGNSNEDRIGPEGAIINIFSELTDNEKGNLPEEKVKRFLLESFFEISEDPKQIKKLLQLRINYNNKIITLLQKMLRTNYQILGISSEEAESLTKGLSHSDSKISGSNIKMIKELIIKNEKKFKPRPDMVDLRSLGFGVAFITNEDLRDVERYGKIDRLIHLLMRYDCVVLGHGSDHSSEWTDKVVQHQDHVKNLNKEYSNVDKQIKMMKKQLEKQYDNDTFKRLLSSGDSVLERIINYDHEDDHGKKFILNWYHIKESDIPKFKDAAKDILDYNKNIKELEDKRTERVKDMESIQDKEKEINSEEEKNRKWGIQNIKTEHGGPYTDINELCEQLIKEGFKKIFLMSCNPGHYKLSNDVLKHKGVIIHNAENTLFAESSVDNNENNEIVTESLDWDITSTELKLIDFCEANEIDYNNQQLLEESYFYLMENQEYLEEGIIGDLWQGLKTLVKKILQALIYLFKNAIAFVRALFNKIRQFFTGVSNPDAEFHNNKVSFISLESAQVKEVNVNNFNQLKVAVIKSCASISKEIDILSQKQTSMTKQTQSYIEKKGRDNMNEMVDMSLIIPYNEADTEIIKEDTQEIIDPNDRPDIVKEALKMITKRRIAYLQESDTTTVNQLTKSYSDTYLYSLVDKTYNEQLMKFIRTSHEIDKTEDSFKDIEYDVKRRQTSAAILNILKSDNIVLMISENNLPLPRTFKVITATDIRPGETKKKKVFIDVTTLITNDNGVYKCNPRSIDILLAYLVNGATQYIYYADPKRIIMDRNMISEGAWCFSKLFTYVIDYLVKVSVNGNMRDQIMYISSVYYLKTVLNKDLSDSHYKICKDISGLSDREIEILNIKFENENYTNIKTFIHGISDLCVNDKITLDVIVNKWIYLYGQGTQFALELFPAFANMITNAYNGQFLNNQPAIEKQCGTHMVNFSKGVLNIIESAIK